MEVAVLNWSKTGCCSINLILDQGFAIVIAFYHVHVSRLCSLYLMLYLYWGKYSPARDPILVTLATDVYEDRKDGPVGQ